MVVIPPPNAPTPPAQTWWCRQPHPLAAVKPNLVSATYASLDDLYTISIPQDQRHDYNPDSLVLWLRVGAARINEWLGQRFAVPLAIWSDTVVWANCEIAYIGATRQRGINSESMLADFRAREELVASWLQRARDHEITPDQRLSAPIRYLSAHSRGWDK